MKRNFSADTDYLPPWDVDIENQEAVVGTAIAMDRIAKAVLMLSGVAAAGVAVLASGALETVSPGTSQMIKDSGLDANMLTEGARNVVTWSTEHPKIAGGAVLLEILAVLGLSKYKKAQRKELEHRVEVAPPPF